MSGRPWDAKAAARSHDARVTMELDRIDLTPDFHGQLRFYLQRMTDQGICKGPRPKQRPTTEGYTQIDVGPTTYRPPCDDCLIFKSGARLSFGITHRTDGSLNKLVSYRFPPATAAFERSAIRSDRLEFAEAQVRTIGDATVAHTPRLRKCTRPISGDASFGSIGPDLPRD